MVVVGHLSGRELLSKGLKALAPFKELSLGVELQLTAQVLESFTLKEFGLIRREMGELPITVHGPFLDLNAGAFDPLVLAATRRRFKETLNAARVLNAEVVVFHTGYHPQKVDPLFESWFEKAVETFRELSESYGGKIALENVFDPTPQVLKALTKNLPENVGVCLDTGHLNLFSSVPLSQWLKLERIFELHVHDNDGTGDHHRPIGTGNFPFRELFKWLEEIKGEKPVINLENKSVQDIALALRNLREVKRDV